MAAMTPEERQAFMERMRARGIDPDPIRRTPGSKWAESAGEPYPNG